MLKIENMTSTTMAPIQVQNFKVLNISLIRGLRFATTTSDQFNSLTFLLILTKSYKS